tara:strand:+ start:75 stop:248 length:174 start_codon:yes stop_codon:yes gene_type:complete
MYTIEQITAVVDVVGVEAFIKHVTNEAWSNAVNTAMFVSHIQNGVLSQEDKDMIATL